MLMPVTRWIKAFKRERTLTKALKWWMALDLAEEESEKQHIAQRLQRWRDASPLHEIAYLRVDYHLARNRNLLLKMIVKSLEDRG